MKSNAYNNILYVADRLFGHIFLTHLQEINNVLILVGYLVDFFIFGGKRYHETIEISATENPVALHFRCVDSLFLPISVQDVPDMVHFGFLFLAYMLCFIAY